MQGGEIEEQQLPRLLGCFPKGNFTAQSTHGMGEEQPARKATP